MLDERLHTLQAAAAQSSGLASTAPVSAPPPHSALAMLTALLDPLTPPAAQAGSPGAPGHGPLPPRRELKALRDYRGTWSRLSVEQRINQALASVPPNAGPLNTQRLVHQTLSALRDASPAYLHRLVSQVEALLWLERLALGDAGSTKKKPERPEAPARPGVASAAGAATGSGRSSARSR